MNNNEKKRLINHMKQFVTDNKQQLMHKTLEKRTRHLTIVLENIFQPQNASAVIRSSECFGVQDLHVIQNEYNFKPNKSVVMGSKKWVHLHHYRNFEDNTATCLKRLKACGYKIVATTLQPGSKPIQQLDLRQKTALCFGTEETGLSPVAHELADELVYIPMHGFTQSFNVSVSAAISLFALTEKLHQSTIEWQLTDDEKEALFLEWLIACAPNGKILAEAFMKQLRGK